MSLFAAILIYALPGSVLALHQGIDHFRGEHVPKLLIFNWQMPYWIFYPLVVFFGPVIMLAILIQQWSGR